VRTLFSRFAGCLYVGEANRQYFKMHSVKDDRLFFTPHAVDGARFAASIDQRASVRESLGIDEVCVVFLFAGKFQMKKRPDLLVAAFRAMPGDGVLLLAGAGEMEPALRRAAAGDERIRFLPFHNQSQMPGLLAAADVVVLPSQGSGETWGLIINEAQALGRPVIVSDHVGCAADLVAAGPDGAPGLIVPAGSRDALTEAMRRLIGDSALRDEMGAAARRRVARYSYAHATAGLLAAVRSVSKREGTRA
jgi:glycosyltransferase involved in cell wall biosynthesis